MNLRLIPLLVCTLWIQLALPARAELIIAVSEFTGYIDDASKAGQAITDNMPHGMQDLVLTEIVTLLQSDPEFKSCAARTIEWARQSDLDAEMEFQKSKYVDRKTAGKADFKTPNRLISGYISVKNNTMEWVIDVHRGGAEKIASNSGSRPFEEAQEAMAEAARDILKKLCTPKPMRIEAKKQDLQINQVVCDMSQPFTLHGTGKTSGLLFNMTPETQSNGEWTVSGSAGGVPWAGGGSYILADMKGKQGFFMEGSWYISTPVGKFSYDGLIPGEAAESQEDCKN